MKKKMMKAILSLPNPIEDKRHRIFIVFEDNRARSNETRFEHIINERHELKPSDIKRIPKMIKSSILRKDETKTNTYNLYIERNNYKKEYIKIALDLNFEKSNIAIVKTVFITQKFK